MNNPIKKLLRTGFFHIVGAGTLNKVLSTLLYIVLVRILSKADYGAYAYAFNIASFFILFNGLGATSAILQLCSETFKDRDKSDDFYAYGYRTGIACDLIMAVAIVFVAAFIPLAIADSNYLLGLYCLYPLLTLLCEVKVMYLRVHMENREYALMSNVQTALLVVFSIGGALAFDAAGLVIGQNITYIVSYLILCRRHRFAEFSRARHLSKAMRGDYWRIALMSSFNNGISQALTLVGTFLVGSLLLDQEMVASYKVATTIPFALLFVPTAIITYAYPYFAQHMDDRAWSIKHYGMLIGGSAVIMFAITLLLELLAEPLTVLIFGEEYLDSVAPFRILMVGFFITASFRQPTGNVLVTQRRLGWNTVIGVVSIVFNVTASYLLIPQYGMDGAALVYTATMALGAVMAVPYYLAIAGRPKQKGK